MSRPLLPDNIGFHIRMVQLRLFREFQRLLDGTGLTPATHTVLTIIRDNPSVHQGDLADILMVKPSNMTALISRLDHYGLVSREVDETDRRACHVKLTSRGRQVLDEAQRCLDALEARLLVNLSGREQKALRSLLDNILARIG